jgi:hypothetical protein
MSQKTNDLTPEREKAVAALVTHTTIEAAAAAVGMSRRTLQRWKQEPTFAAAYRAARQSVIESTTNQLRNATGKAVDKLESLLDGREDVACRAAIAILDRAYKAFELEDLAERLDALEQAIGDKGS